MFKQDALSGLVLPLTPETFDVPRCSCSCQVVPILVCRVIDSTWLVGAVLDQPLLLQLLLILLPLLLLSLSISSYLYLSLSISISTYLYLPLSIYLYLSISVYLYLSIYLYLSLTGKKFIQSGLKKTVVLKVF